MKPKDLVFFGYYLHKNTKVTSILIKFRSQNIVFVYNGMTQTGSITKSPTIIGSYRIVLCCNNIQLKNYKGKMLNYVIYSFSNSCLVGKDLKV